LMIDVRKMDSWRMEGLGYSRGDELGRG